MDIVKIIQINKDTIEKLNVFDGVKIRGSIIYHNFVDQKWVFYINSCTMSTKNGTLNFEKLKMLLLCRNYTVPEGYSSIVGTNGDTPFILSPEINGNSEYKIPESYSFGEYVSSDTRRRKYRVKVKKLVIIKKNEIFDLSEVMLDLHYQ